MPASVELRDIRKRFGATEIIKGVSLSIAPGEFVVFVGPSGCGKSTLLRMIAGLEDITAGELRFDDAVVNDWDPARRRIGMVFQSYALYPHMTVEQNIGFGLKLAKMPPAERAARVDRALEVLQLTALRRHKPSQLSGGQRQRVAIGRAIVRNPNVFLFDEPLSNLDAAMRGHMRMEISKLHQQLHNTVIYVTHDQVEAMTLADRIVVLEAGVIRQIGTPMELYRHPANRFVAGFIGTPTMGFLAARVVAAGASGVGLALAGGSTVRVPNDRAALPLGADLMLGVRPEHCRVCAAGEAMLAGRVVMLERLGADTFAYVDVPGARDPVAVRLGAGDGGIGVGHPVALRFEVDQVHLFSEDGAIVVRDTPRRDQAVCSTAGEPVSDRDDVDDIGRERFRPQFHFTPRRNWMNDPNGLVYFGGEYHLFFQHNPRGKGWGNMCWGHAVSVDMLHWQELGIAIPETEHMIFSGSIVVDWANVSGLGDGKAPPLLAFFTGFDARRNVQSQHLAYSHDRGRSFRHYARNPIIDLHAADFRDPKVFYHAPSAAWILVVVLAVHHVVQFYRSSNLTDWALAGEFTGGGSTAGKWECPDLIRVPVEGGAGEARWVLKVDVDQGLVGPGSGAQYFVGDFDGFYFTIDPVYGSTDGALVDFGPDFYAATTWSDLPADQPGPVWIGWQSNHQTGKDYPTHPWCGAMSMPRRLFLYAADGALQLGQAPIDALATLQGAPTGFAPRMLARGGDVFVEVTVSAFCVDLSLSRGEDTRFSIAMESGADVLLTIEVDMRDRTINFTRNSSWFATSDRFARSTLATLPHVGDQIDITIFFDGSLVEIFVEHGRRVCSACVFPSGPLALRVKNLAEVMQIQKLDLSPMETAMNWAMPTKR